MKSLSFTLSGQMACFRRPDVNAKVYFTYNNVHKVALLGLLGAIIGFKGYYQFKTEKDNGSEFPEFYEKLSPLLISIVPNGKNGYFSKKVQYFNNSVGYASKEEGGNLQVQEQWLENPSWTIFLMQNEVDDLTWHKILDHLTAGKCIYIPYLGRNDFPAEIKDVKEVNLEPSRSQAIHSLFMFNDDLKKINEGRGKFLFVETAPIKLVPVQNFYEYSRFVFTDYKIPIDYLPKCIYTDGIKHYNFN